MSEEQNAATAQSTSGIERTAKWNAYAARNVQYHCPETGKEWMGSSNTCPDCHTNLSHLSHWKWFNPDEPHPREAVLDD